MQRVSCLRDRGVRRAEGHELDEAAAALVPTTAIGRLLEPDGAAKLIRRIERGNPETAGRGIDVARGEAEAGLAIRAQREPGRACGGPARSRQAVMMPCCFRCCESACFGKVICAQGADQH